MLAYVKFLLTRDSSIMEVYNFYSIGFFILRSPIPHATHGTSDHNSLDFASLVRKL